MSGLPERGCGERLMTTRLASLSVGKVFAAAGRRIRRRCMEEAILRVRAASLPGKHFRGF
jgi:hypothetical protein